MVGELEKPRLPVRASEAGLLVVFLHVFDFLFA